MLSRCGACALATGIKFGSAAIKHRSAGRGLASRSSPATAKSLDADNQATKKSGKDTISRTVSVRQASEKAKSKAGLPNLNGPKKTKAKTVAGGKKRADQDYWADRARAGGLRSRAAFKLMDMQQKFRLFSKRSFVLELGAAPGGWTQVLAQQIDLRPALVEKESDLNDGNHTSRVMWLDVFFQPRLKSEDDEDDFARTSSSSSSSLGSTSTKMSPLGNWKEGHSKRKAGVVIALDQTEMDPIPGVLHMCADMHDPATREKLDHVLMGYKLDSIVSDMAPNTTGVKVTDHVRSMELVNSALDLANYFLAPSGSFVCKVFKGEDEQAFVKRLDAHFRSVKGYKPKASVSESKEFYYVCQGFVPQRLKDLCASSSTTHIDDEQEVSLVDNVLSERQFRSEGLMARGLITEPERDLA
ncbi:Ribosomal RNA large subunit methyltransferase E [Porphyridium purpureum]|uniref:rRNA methyltransferase 2, mitochondrial n=1 Tax=Porphyridium purpureum TaxID=35688 RepID=A0A5J4Z9L9_PORPP|nr:Ribosomal RNA large subunit methyltransferase E [Porphyridium purpureum]|eukprot:POR7097..scf295_1